MTSEEDQVAQDQVEEDFELFGDRAIPPDIRRKAANMETDPYPQISEIGNLNYIAAWSEHSHRPDTVMDHEMEDAFSQDQEIGAKASGHIFHTDEQAPPLLYWLERTESPQNPTMVHSELQEKRARQEELRIQEMEDIELFCNVHVVPSQQALDNPASAKTYVSREDELEFSARIYYRNIIDRYQGIPHYLARRLAEANLSRAKRLALAKSRTGQEKPPSPFSPERQPAIPPKDDANTNAKTPDEKGTERIVSGQPIVASIRRSHLQVNEAITQYPNGFRGEHELRGHTERNHQRMRKFWVTVDASPGKKFLADCKQCSAGKKYTAYYNAAAHLRRVHFHPRKRGRKGKNKEKLGSKGGGDDPPMEVLKQHWLKEVEVEVSPERKVHTIDSATVHENNPYAISLERTNNIGPITSEQQSFKQEFWTSSFADLPTMESDKKSLADLYTANEALSWLPNAEENLDFNSWFPDLAAVDSQSLSRTSDKRRNKLDYHRTSVACGEHSLCSGFVGACVWPITR